MLAGHLGGKSIEEWKGVITRPEFLAWVEFFKLNPFDDAARYHRPAALVASQMSGADVPAMLDWLRGSATPAAESGYSAADLATFKAFGMKPPPRAEPTED